MFFLVHGEVAIALAIVTIDSVHIRYVPIVTIASVVFVCIPNTVSPALFLLVLGEVAIAVAIVTIGSVHIRYVSMVANAGVVRPYIPY